MKSVLQVIGDRVSQKSFTDRPVSEEDLRTILDAAVLAPNHKMTQPWTFTVLGQDARRRFGQIKAERVKMDDPVAAAEKKQRLIENTAALPAVIIVGQEVADDALRRQEDYAAVFMGIQNMLLVATSLGLGSKVNTGEILDAPALRELVSAKEGEQLVAMINIGEPAEPMKPKPRVPASEKTRWIP